MKRAVGLVVLAIAAAACEPAAEGPSSTPAPTVTPAVSPTPAEPSPTPLPDVRVLTSGLACRDLEARGYPFADAVTYWVMEGQPARMDADLDGVPCETAYPAAEVAVLVERPTTVGEWIVARNAREVGKLPESVVRPDVVECDVLGPIRRGSVFACALQPQTEPGVSFENAGMVVLILDDEGGWATAAGSDVPDATSTVLRLYEEAGSGLYCRDLATRAPYPFSDGYFWAVAYWFLEGMPDRMDADLDGIPCETVFAPGEVRRVWDHGMGSE